MRCRRPAWGWAFWSAYLLLMTASLGSTFAPPVAEASPRSGAVRIAAGGATACTITGTSGPDVLRGTSRSDVICGRGGADTIHGGGGNDRVVGGPGRDVLYGGGGADLLSGGGGKDRLVGGTGNDLLRGGAGADTIDGGAGNDSLSGGMGHDALHGRGGRDTLSGGQDHDRLAGGAGADALRGGSGADVADFAAATGSVKVDLAGKTATGEGRDKLADVEAVTGSRHDDVLVGTRTRNRLVGGAGDDLIRARAGDDVVVGGAGDDDLFGQGDDDVVRGGADDDVVNGGLGVDTCVGGTGFDIIELNCDSTPPRIRWVTVSPTTFDTSQQAVTLTFHVRVTDGLAGVDRGHFNIDAPSGSYYGGGSWDARDRVSGNEKDGVYRWQMTLPRYAPQGRYVIGEVGVVDSVANGRALSASDLERANLDVVLQQVGPGDEIAPRLRSFDVVTESIDTSQGPATVVVEGRLTDNLSGVSYAAVDFYSPTSSQSQRVFFDEASRVGGTARDGSYRAELTMPRYSAAGTWRVYSVVVYDNAGHHRYIDGYSLSQAGYDRTFEQRGAGDVTPPTVHSLSVSPRNIDTSLAPATVTIEARITDDLAGFFEAKGYLCADSARQSQWWYLGEWQRVAGDDRDGVYRYEVVIPRYSQHGTWRVCGGYIADKADNGSNDSGIFPDAAFYNGPTTP